MRKYLIVGLGNIGNDYEETRHNIGFKIVDHFSKKYETCFEKNKLGSTAEIKLKGRQITLLKPNTYMNLSGKSIFYWLTKKKIDIDNLLVITDDIHLEFGFFRLKGKGSNGGHNGLKSIEEHLQTNKYPRFKFGISNNFSKSRQIDYVLGAWGDKEKESLQKLINTGGLAIESFVLSGLSNTMNHYNGLHTDKSTSKID